VTISGMFVSDLDLSGVIDLYFRAREALRACLPEPLRDQTFSVLLKVRCVSA
jgi:hypothetical protein